MSELEPAHHAAMGALVRLARKGSGPSVRDLAEKSGLDTVTIGRIERGGCGGPCSIGDVQSVVAVLEEYDNWAP